MEMYTNEQKNAIKEIYEIHKNDKNRLENRMESLLNVPLKPEIRQDGIYLI